MKPSSNRFLLLLSIALSSVASAATNPWIGDTSNVFTNNLNWTGDSLPNFGTDIMRFDGPGSQGNSTITGVNLTMTNTGTSAGTNLAQILFSGSTPAMTLTGGTINLGTAASNIYNNTILLSSGSTVTQTIGSNVVIGDGAAYTASVVNNSTTGGLLKFTGNISGGTGALTTGLITFSFGNTSAHNGNYEVTGNITKGGASAITTTKRGTGTLTLSGINVIDTLNNSNETGSTVVFSGGTTTLGTALNFSNTAGVNTTVRVNGGILNLSMADSTSGWGGGTGGSLFRVSSGTVNSSAGRAIKSSILIDGGTLNINAGASRLSFAAGANLEIASGNLNIASGITNGARLGNASGNGAAQTGATDFTATHSGGNFTVYGAGGATTTFSMGGTEAKTIAYNLSGGVLDVRGTNDANGHIQLGSDVGGLGTTTLALSGTGKLISRFAPGSTGGIAGTQTGAAQVLALQGGTLVAGRIEAANLRGSAGGTNGTIVNNGSNIAPGDIGTAGRTTINGGSLAINSGTLSIDIGGATAASNFQDTGAFFDVVRMIAATHSVTLGGRLAVNIINSFNPIGNYDIINSSGATSVTYTGNFTNIMTGVGGVNKVVLADGLSSFTELVDAANLRVRLTGYQTTNTYNAASGSSWNAVSAASWSAFDAGSTATPSSQASGAIAQFADGALTGSGANTVNLSAIRNLQGVQFSSAATGHNYTIANDGGGSIILDNTGNNANATLSDSSAGGNSNAINVPITLVSNLTASVTDAANTLTIGGDISGTGKGLTKTGHGALTLTGTNSYTGVTAVNSGTLLIGTSGSLANTAVTVGGSGAAGTPTLGGGGTIGGATSIAAAGGGIAGTHAVGVGGVNNGVGTQTFNSTLDYGTGSIFEWTLQAASSSDPGVVSNAATGTYDKVVANGAVSGSGAVFKIVLGGNSFTDAFWNTDKTWTDIFSGTGAPNNLATIFTTFSGTNVNTDGTVVGNSGYFTFNGSSTLTWSAVPEPTSALAGLLVAAGLLRRRRSA